MCKRLGGISYERDWCRRSRWERIHWFTFMNMEPDAEMFHSFEDLDMAFGEFRALTGDQKQAASEYDQYKENLQLLSCTRKDFIGYDPAWRKTKLDMARRTKAQNDGNNQ